MSQRKTIRPVTLRRVIELCQLVKQDCVDLKSISQVLKTSESRTIEIVKEVRRMKLIALREEICMRNQNTINFLNHFKDEKWYEIHKYFLANYSFYRDFIEVISTDSEDDLGLSRDAIQQHADRQRLNLNRTAIEVLSDWCDRLDVIQRHLYHNRLYLIRNGNLNKRKFAEKLIQCFEMLVSNQRVMQIFVEIPRLRENVCERLKIKREVFDSMLKELYLKNIGKIELSGAPITTMAKESPLGEKEIRLHSKEHVISPRFVLRRKREGLVFRNKTYFYLALHENLTGFNKS